MLEIWEAERFEEEKQSGRTRPMVIECEKPTVAVPEQNVDKNAVIPDTIKRLMLVKVQNAELSPRGLFSEVYGNLIAREFGVTTPTPALINIGPDFVQAMKLLPQMRQSTLAPGVGVGCEYLRGLAPVSTAVSRNNEELADIQAVFGVDVLIQNPDRRPDKPNCASYQGGVLAYDFELAFSFLLPLIGTQPPSWAVHEQGINKMHLFYAELKRRNTELDWTPFLKTLAALTDARLASIFGSVSVDWRVYADKVMAHLGEVRNNVSKFEASLVRSLL